MELFRLMGSVLVDNTKANESLDQTDKKASGAGEKLGKIVGTAGKVGAAVLSGAAVAVGGLTTMVSKVTETTGAISDSAKKTGMTAEAYQKYAYAAKLSGMEASTLESAMVKQQKAFSDASTGSKTAQAAYAALGLDVKKLGSSGEAFDQVIAKLADMDDETQRNAIANDIFGKSYAELSPLLSEGSEGINKLKQEAVDMGAVLSNDAVDSGEKLGDTFDKISMAAGGAVAGLAGSLVPIVLTFADLIIENMPMIQSMFAQIGPVLGEFFAAAMPILMQLIQQLMPVLLDIIKGLLPVIIQLMPLFLKIIESVLPPVLKLLDLLLPPLLKLLNIIIPPLTAVIDVLAQAFGETLGFAIDALMPIIDNIIGALSGIINFVTGIFSGNWKQAWQGIVDTFGNIFSGIGNLIKAPLNYLIDMINSAFAKIGSITVPDWIPGIGGKSFSLPHIPRLAVGLDYVPYDEFPALLHKGERVLTAEEAKAGNRGGITINIASFVNNRKQDVQQLAEELDYYMNRKAAANGMA